MGHMVKKFKNIYFDYLIIFKNIIILPVLVLDLTPSIHIFLDLFLINLIIWNFLKFILSY